MKHNVILTITSLLSMLFLTFHLTDDIVRGMEAGGLSTLLGVLILVVWLYGTLVLAERRPGEAAAYMRFLHSDFVCTILPRMGEKTHVPLGLSLRELGAAAYEGRFTAAISRPDR